MITKDEVLGLSQGTLQLGLYVVTAIPTGDLDPVVGQLDAHLAYAADLERRGILFGGGPLFYARDAEWEGEIMSLLKVEGLAEAQEVAAADPLATSGVSRHVVRPWLMNDGGLTLRLSFSGRRLSVA